MNYPVWEVPVIGTPWVVGMIAIFHVMISHFAVGGGAYLTLALRKAYLGNHREWLPIIKQHSKFFLVVTGVFGTVSGVGIWFAIGLVNPSATSALIHNFVFGWAIEWLFFLIEVTAILVLYYTWDRIPEKVALNVSYVYAISSILTLVIINGILTFMLTPGHVWLQAAGTGNEPSVFWYAFFNPTYWPSLIMRMLVMMALAGVWALVSFSKLEQGKTRDQMIRWSTSWLIPAFLLLPIVFVWYRQMIPYANRHLMELGMATIGSGLFTQITRIALISIMSTATIAAIAYFFAYKSPRDFTLGHAVSLLFIALLATASTEYAREAIRKPYVIGSYMYSSGVRVKDVKHYQDTSYLAASMWRPDDTPPSLYEEGRFVFRGQCMGCHTIDGYRGIKGLTMARDDKSLNNVLLMLREYKPDSPYHAFMPPLAANDQEIQALKVYLLTLNNKTIDTANVFTSKPAPPDAKTAATTTPVPAGASAGTAPAVASPAAPKSPGTLDVVPAKAAPPVAPTSAAAVPEAPAKSRT
ncbi:MAG TPA: cytochrome ubiquinol oxidase subunit I [Capsulimonadaceae bacterium]|jgi:cytochrome bd-type quinol oxidase subunit 1